MIFLMTHYEDKVALDIQANTKTSPYNILKNIPHEIFRAYDIRGIVDESITPNGVYTIGLAIGSEAQDRTDR